MVQALELGMPEIPNDARLRTKAYELACATARIGAGLHPQTQECIAAWLRLASAYYSGVLAGNDKTPRSLLGQLRGLGVEAGAGDITLREHQLVAAARVTSPAFIRSIHKTLSGMSRGQNKSALPGHWRCSDMLFDAPYPPAAQTLPRAMNTFHESYDPARIDDPLERILAAAVSHLQLFRIHPFEGDNARVCRLFTGAYLIQAGIDANGLWCLNRGLAQTRQRYTQYLMGNDNILFSEYAGPASPHEYREFCDYFLDVSWREAVEMQTLLTPAALGARLEHYLEQNATELDGRVQPAIRLMMVAALQGDITAERAREVLAQSRSGEADIIHALEALGVIERLPYGDSLHVHMAPRALPVFLPGVFPKRIEAALDTVPVGS